MEDPDKKAELQRLINEAITPKKCVPFFDEDIVPSLPPDWKPPSFSQEMKFFADVSAFNEEIKKDFNDEIKKDLNEEVSLM